MITKSEYYKIYGLLDPNNGNPYEDIRERRVILNKFLAEKNKADIDELTKQEAEILITWLEAVC